MPEKTGAMNASEAQTVIAMNCRLLCRHCLISGEKPAPDSRKIQPTATGLGLRRALQWISVVVFGEEVEVTFSNP